MTYSSKPIGIQLVGMSESEPSSLWIPRPLANPNKMLLRPLFCRWVIAFNDSSRKSGGTCNPEWCTETWWWYRLVISSVWSGRDNWWNQSKQLLLLMGISHINVEDKSLTCTPSEPNAALSVESSTCSCGEFSLSIKRSFSASLGVG